MSKIVTIDGNVPYVAPGQPNEAIVKCLERLLAEAKSGELVALGVAAVASRSGNIFFSDECYWNDGLSSDMFVAAHRLVNSVEQKCGVRN